MQPGPHNSRQAFDAKVGLHVSGKNYIASKVSLFGRAKEAWVMHPGDVIHHENPHSFDAVCGGFFDIALPEYVVSVVMRKRFRKMPVFSAIRPSKRIVAMQARSEGDLSNLRNSFCGVVVPLIKMSHVRAHLSNTFNYHPIDFANMGTNQIALFETAGEILRNIGMSVEELGIDSEIMKGFKPCKFVDLSECRSDDEDGLDFPSAEACHNLSSGIPIHEEHVRLGPPVQESI